MKKLLITLVISTNILASTSQYIELKEILLDRPRQSTVSGIKAEFETLSSEFDRIQERRVLTKYPIDEIIEGSTEKKERSKSAFSRGKNLTGNDRKRSLIGKEAEEGVINLGIKYFDYYGQIDGYKNEINRLRAEIERLNSTR